MSIPQYCKKPPIKEAFCLIQGKPSEFNETDAPSLENQASKHYKSINKTLESIPALVMIPKDSTLMMNPFWTKQKKWDNGSFVSRFGHRYLSIHRLCNNDNRYTRYEDSLKPEIEKWIELYDQVLTDEVDGPHEIELITFGYINELFVPLDDEFSLSKYIKLFYQLELDAGPVDTMNRSSFNFNLSSSISGIRCTIKVKVERTTEGKEMKLTIEIYSTRSGFSSKKFTREDILEPIEELKNHAKGVFFSFITEHVKDDIIEVVYD